jgi:hypothetical protein
MTLTKIRVLQHPATRLPLGKVRGSGLNADHSPKQAAVAIANPFSRAIRNK